jgi:hypothetical protein
MVKVIVVAVDFFGGVEKETPPIVGALVIK